MAHCAPGADDHHGVTCARYHRRHYSTSPFELTSQVADRFYLARTYLFKVRSYTPSTPKYLSQTLPPIQPVAMSVESSSTRGNSPFTCWWPPLTVVTSAHAGGLHADVPPIFRIYCLTLQGRVEGRVDTAAYRRLLIDGTGTPEVRQAAFRILQVRPFNAALPPKRYARGLRLFSRFISK